MCHLTRVAPQRHDTLLRQAEHSTCMHIVVGCIQSDGCITRFKQFAAINEETAAFVTSVIVIEDGTPISLLCLSGVL